VVGEVKDMDCILVDDIIDTAGTLSSAAEALMKEGAKSVVACCTHAVLSGPAIKRIQESPLKKLLVTNTIPLSKEAEKCSKIEQLSVSSLLGQGISRIAKGDSVSSLFV
jgi:ribose-phosphate pyrophosphokinase